MQADFMGQRTGTDGLDRQNFLAKQQQSLVFHQRFDRLTTGERVGIGGWRREAASDAIIIHVPIGELGTEIGKSIHVVDGVVQGAPSDGSFGGSCRGEGDDLGCRYRWVRNYK
jgi:hypothetical protein